MRRRRRHDEDEGRVDMMKSRVMIRWEAQSLLGRNLTRLPFASSREGGACVVLAGLSITNSTGNSKCNTELLYSALDQQAQYCILCHK